MLSLIILLIAFFTIIIGKTIFKKWFNHITLYCITWGGMLSLYNLKLLSYLDIVPIAWFLIVVAFLTFLIGSITPFAIKKPDQNLKDDFNILFFDNGKYLRTALYVLGFISFFGALYNWYVLYKMFGSIVKIFLSANIIYRMRVDAEIPGLLPYLGGVTFAGLVLAGIYTAYKNKITIPVIMLLIAAILRDLATFARVGILISLVVFVCSLFLYRHFISHISKISRTKITLLITISLALVILAASTVKLFRGSYERYQGTSSSLSAFKDNPVISPSLYLYLSSHVGVFSKYIEEDNENTRFGINTLSPVYNFLAKFGLTEKAPFHQKGYLIPMWTNSSTYLRELHADFGPIGILIVPYFIGLFTSIFWLSFYRSGSYYSFVLLTMFTSLITLTFFSLINRTPDFYTAILFLFISFWYVKRKYRKKLLLNE